MSKYVLEILSRVEDEGIAILDLEISADTIDQLIQGYSVCFWEDGRYLWSSKRKTGIVVQKDPVAGVAWIFSDKKWQSFGE